MRKSLMIGINAVLGAIALFLAGCGAQGRTVKNRGTICMYGIPQEFLDQRQAREDSLQQVQPKQSADSLSIQPTSNRSDTMVQHRPMVKYGPRPI